MFLRVTFRPTRLVKVFAAEYGSVNVFARGGYFERAVFAIIGSVKSIGYRYLIETFKLNVCELQSRAHLTNKSVHEVRRLFAKNSRGRLSAAKRHFFAELTGEEVGALEQIVCPSGANE